MTLWAIVFVVVGLGLAVYGGNGALADRLGERDQVVRRTDRWAASGRRAMLKVGMVLVGLGAAMFALGILIHTVMAVLTILMFVTAVVVVLWVLAVLRRPRTR